MSLISFSWPRQFCFIFLSLVLLLVITKTGTSGFFLDSFVSTCIRLQVLNIQWVIPWIIVIFKSDLSSLEINNSAISAVAQWCPLESYNQLLGKFHSPLLSEWRFPSWSQDDCCIFRHYILIRQWSKQWVRELGPKRVSLPFWSGKTVFSKSFLQTFTDFSFTPRTGSDTYPQSNHIAGKRFFLLPKENQVVLGREGMSAPWQPTMTGLHWSRKLPKATEPLYR